MKRKWTPAGELRQQVTIQQETTSTDAYGAAVPSWSAYATVLAKVEQLDGREQFYAQQVQPLATHRVTCRYLAGVTPAMKLTWSGSGEGARTLQIVDVNDVEGQGFELRLLCVEKK